MDFDSFSRRSDNEEASVYRLLPLPRDRGLPAPDLRSTIGSLRVHTTDTEIAPVPGSRRMLEVLGSRIKVDTTVVEERVEVPQFIRLRRRSVVAFGEEFIAFGGQNMVARAEKVASKVERVEAWGNDAVGEGEEVEAEAKGVAVEKRAVMAGEKVVENAKKEKEKIVVAVEQVDKQSAMENERLG